MNADKMYEELVDKVGILPVICDEGLEHSDSWMEIESKNGEEEVIVCSKCGEGMLQRKEKAGEQLMREVLEDFIKKNQIN